jgi:FKBP-type peptidyl-prolyl cis-trans isomerase
MRVAVSSEGVKLHSTTKEGNGKQPKQGQTVTMHYVCANAVTGEVYDSSVAKNRPFKFKLGTGQVIKGWDIGVAQMTLGQKAKLTCAPEFAYGSQGAGNVIPGNTTLCFDVELLAIDD